MEPLACYLIGGTAALTLAGVGYLAHVTRRAARSAVACVKSCRESALDAKLAAQRAEGAANRSASAAGKSERTAARAERAASRANPALDIEPPDVIPFPIERVAKRHQDSDPTAGLWPIAEMDQDVISDRG